MFSSINHNYPSVESCHLNKVHGTVLREMTDRITEIKVPVRDTQLGPGRAVSKSLDILTIYL